MSGMSHKIDMLRDAFEDWINNRPDWWDQFNESDWRICSKGCPRQGEYAHHGLQQLWECWMEASTRNSGAKS